MIQDPVIKKQKSLLEIPVNLKISKFFTKACKDGSSPIAIISNINTISVENDRLNYVLGEESPQKFLISLNLNVQKNIKEIIHSFYSQLNDRWNYLSEKKIKAKDDNQIPLSFEILYNWLSSKASSESNDTFLIYLSVQCNIISNEYHKTLLKDFFHCLFKSQTSPLENNLSFCILLSCDIFDFRTTSQNHNVIDTETQPNVQISSALLDILEPNNFDEKSPRFVCKLFSFPTKAKCFDSFITVSCIDYDNCLIQPGPSLIKSLKQCFFTHVTGVDVLWRLLKHVNLKQKLRYFIFLRDVQIEPNDFSIHLNLFLQKVNKQAKNLLVQKYAQLTEDQKDRIETKTDFKKKLRIRSDGKYEKKDEMNQILKRFPLDTIRAFTPSFKVYVNQLEDSTIKKKLLTDDAAFTEFLVECSAKIMSYRACLGPCLNVLHLFCQTFSHETCQQEEMDQANLYCQVLQGNIKKCVIVCKSLANLHSPTQPTPSSLTQFIEKSSNILSNTSCSLSSILNDMTGPLSKLHQILNPLTAESSNDQKAKTLHKGQENVVAIEKLINTLLSDYLWPPKSLICHELYYLENESKEEDSVFRDLYPCPAIDMTRTFDNLLMQFQREDPGDRQTNINLVYAATAYQIAITEKSTAFYTRKIKLLDWFEAFQESIRSNYLGEVTPCPELVEAFKQALLDLRFIGLAKPRKRVKSTDSFRYWDITIFNFA